MDFTREPIIESIISPKEGYKLVIRSSKGAGHEEFFVDVVEVVSFGHTFFLRSLERAKAFLVPASDYEILEVRETRMVLKNVGMDSNIKIGGGKEQPSKKEEKPQQPKEAAEAEDKLEKRRDRRRQSRRRRNREDVEQKDQPLEEVLAVPQDAVTEEGNPTPPRGTGFATLLPPPSTLISETIARYKGDQSFKDVFFPKEEAVLESEFVPPFEPEDEELSDDPFNIKDEEPEDVSAPSMEPDEQ